MKRQKLKEILELFYTFFVIGLTTFGGGYAMIPIVRNKVVEKKQWIDEQEMIKILAVSESTPGPIAINMATFIGYKKGGAIGAFAATFGVVLPSFAIILAISLLLNNIMEYPLVVSIFNGIRCAVAVLIMWTAINMFAKMKKTAFTVTLALLTAALLTVINIFAWNFSAVYLVLAGLVIGVVAVIITDMRAKGKQAEYTDKTPSQSVSNSDNYKKTDEKENKQ